MDIQQIEKEFIIVQNFEYDGKKILYARDKVKHLPVFFEEKGESFVFVSPQKYFELRSIFERKVSVDHIVRSLGKQYVTSNSEIQKELYPYLEGDRYFEHMEYIPDKQNISQYDFPFKVVFEEPYINSRIISKQRKMEIIEVIKSAINDQLDEIDMTCRRKSFFVQKLKSFPITISLYEFNTNKYLGYCCRKKGSHIAVNFINGSIYPKTLISTVRHEVNHSLTVGEDESTGLSDKKGNFVAVNEALTEICSHTQRGRIPARSNLSYEEYVNVILSLDVDPIVIYDIYFSRFSPKQKVDLLVDEIVRVNKTSREMVYKIFYQMDIIFNIEDILDTSKISGLNSTSAIKSLQETLFEIKLASVTANNIEIFELIPQFSVKDLYLTFTPFEKMKNSRMEKVKKGFLKSSIENCKLKKEGIVLPNGLFVYHNKMQNVCNSVGVNYKELLDQRIADSESKSRIQFEKEKLDSDSFDALLSRSLGEENTSKTLVEMYRPDMPHIQKQQIATFLCVCMYYEEEEFNLYSQRKRVREIFLDVSRGLSGSASLTPNNLVAEMMKFATNAKEGEMLFEIVENYSKNKNIREEKSFFEVFNFYSDIELYRKNPKDYFDIKYEMVRRGVDSESRLFPNITLSRLGLPNRFEICASSYKKLKDLDFLKSEIDFFHYVIDRAIDCGDNIIFQNLYNFAEKQTNNKNRDQNLFLLKSAIKRNFERSPDETAKFLKKSGNIFLYDESFPSHLISGELSRFLIPILKGGLINEQMFIEREFQDCSNELELDAGGVKMTYLTKLLCLEDGGKVLLDSRKVAKFIEVAESVVSERERQQVKSKLLTGIKSAGQTLGIADFDEWT